MKVQATRSKLVFSSPTCKTLVLAGGLFFSQFFLVHCSGKKDADKVAEAQVCLNSSTQSTAADCVSKVDGLDSPGANAIRCSAIFIQQGFSNPETVASIANTAKNGTGSSSTAAIMGAFAFRALSTPIANYNQSQQALTYCSNAGSKGLAFLATTAGLATTANYLTTITAGCTSTNDVTAALNCLKGANNASADSAVGTVVLSAYTVNCVGTQSGANQEFCSQFTTATANCAAGDTACIGGQFLNNY